MTGPPKAFLAAIALCAIALTAAPIASAGQYNITLTDSTAPGFCGSGLFGFTGGLPFFGDACQGAGPTGNTALSISSVQGTTVYANSYYNAFWQTRAPAGLTIADARATYEASDLTNGWGAGAFWNGGSGGDPWDSGLPGPQSIDSGAISSPDWAFQLVCPNGGCSGTIQAAVQLDALTLQVSEAQGPTLGAPGATNLWNQTGWVWNAPSDPWTFDATGGDPSGVCSIDLTVNGSAQSYRNAPNPAAYQQCNNPWSASQQVDTSQYESASGPLALGVAETDAAANESSASQTVDVDNVTPSVSISPTNDTNPGGWAVNHAVDLEIAPVAGPSGVSSVACSDNGNALTLAADPNHPGDYTTSVDGNGTHSVSCTVANNAVDPQGAHNNGAATELVDIDEQAPSVSFEGQDAAAPAQVDVNTADSESPVTGGSLEMAPAGTTNWIQIPTTFTGGQLVGQIPDSGHKGQYVVQATATSQVGNAGTATETLTLPLRAHAHSDVSFGKLVDPLVAKKVRKRVLVGWHYGAKLNRQGQPVKVKVGGHYVTRTVITYVEQCRTKKVRVPVRGTTKTRTRVETKTERVCLKPHLIAADVAHLRYGTGATLRGLLISAQGTPIAGQTVDILSSPDNGLHSYAQIGTATSAADGAWSARLPAGPSRIIKAYYPGSSTILPATGAVRTITPARITIRIAPTTLEWNEWITISGQLTGGYVPSDGVALRLLVRYPGSSAGSPLLAFRTDSQGRFRIRWTYNAGRGILTLPFWVASDSNESDYPFAASASGHVKVTFGAPTPRRVAVHRSPKMLLVGDPRR